jgi:hypothetical protein
LILIDKYNIPKDIVSAEERREKEPLVKPEKSLTDG